MIPVVFEPDYQKKLLSVSFSEPVTLSSVSQIEEWKQEWCRALKSWHTPYKALVDLSSVSWEPSEREVLYKKFGTMVRFLKGFFLRKIAVYGFEDGDFPVASFLSLEEAYSDLGIRFAGARSPSDRGFRDSVLIQNHFAEKWVELTFEDEVDLDDAKKIKVLRSKLTNNLMHWHSPWCLLWDFSAVKTLSPDLVPEVKSMLDFLGSFFMKTIHVYGASSALDLTAFNLKSHRSRHKALLTMAAHLSKETTTEEPEDSCPSRGNKESKG